MEDGTPATGASAAEQLLDGRYALGEPLGRGGMATVYRARDRRLDRPVAVKVLDDAASDAAGVAPREDRIVARLAHPHIVGIYDAGTTPDGRPFLVMQLIEGEPVSRLAPLPLDRALAVAEEVAAALAHAHARGVVHCDLKPQNVLLDVDGRAKLTDFGVACADAAPVGEVIYGSAAYIAPERLRGAPTSPAVDIYALGALLYFLIAGQSPYGGAGGGAIVPRVLNGPPPALGALVPGLPPAVDAIVRRAMAPDPADRFPTAEVFRRALAGTRRALAARRGAAPRPARPVAGGPIARPVQRRPHGLAGAAGLAELRARRAVSAGYPSVALGAALLVLLTVFLIAGAAPRIGDRSTARVAASGDAATATMTATAAPEATAVATIGPEAATVAAAAPTSTTAPTPAPTGTAAATVPATATGVQAGAIEPPATAPAVPTPAPTPTDTPIPPIRVEAAISDPAPPRTARLTVTGRLLRGDAGIAGVPMRTIWHFRSGDATCGGGQLTNAAGEASCAFTMSGATAGHEVVVEVLFEYEGRIYQTEARFTPR